MGCVGGRVVCVCELINLRCVFVGMCVKGPTGWGSVFWGGGEGTDCVVFGGPGCGYEKRRRGKKKQEDRGEKVHIIKSAVVFSMKLVIKRLLR